MARKGFRLAKLALPLLLLPVLACQSEVLRQQEAQIRQQQEEIERQRKEIEALAAGQQLEDKKRADCNRAFRDYFEKGQSTADRQRMIELYQDGLKLCPEDDVAHYELGRAYQAGGRNQDAEKEYETALRINPAFGDARRELEALRKNR